MRLLKKLLKFLVLATAAIAVLVGGWLGYMKYEQAQREQAELSFLTSDKWVWYDKYERIQSNYNPFFKKTLLRKVNLNKQYVIYASKSKDYILSARATFAVDCTPNTSIVTSKVFSDGEPKVLHCSSDGKSLSYGVQWSSGNTDVVWSENLDGFEIYENFRDWDFSVLDREITLSKAN
ncbi:hypothetical protein L1D31_21845 [Vibrio sp. Isolate23]|uniref:hypothetical protein n=1 Tax=Vibrio sp. Isolate23 TaxID=2908533 RepID=UPI001EFC8E15|nr:hypothetical protein [Vibrio sp. Isolate23]MCG9685169.1 hypothetical protein [Vibrio sp. Isolate23]